MTDTRKVVGKDRYENLVFQGQVPIKDAHGNIVFREPEVGSGADHLEHKHRGKAGARDTGRKDAHGNAIWTSAEEED